MKKAPIFIAWSIGLTVVFYMLAYYLLPPPPPSAGMVLLFAAVAMILIWAIGAAISKFRAGRAGASGPGSPGAGTHAALALLLLGALSLIALKTANPASVSAAAYAQESQSKSKVALSTVCKFTSGPRTGTTEDYAELAPAPIGSPCTDGEGSRGSVVARDPFQHLGIGSFGGGHSHGHDAERTRSKNNEDSLKNSPRSSGGGHGKPSLGPPVVQGISGGSPPPPAPPPPPPASIGQGAPPPMPLPPPSPKPAPGSPNSVAADAPSPGFKARKPPAGGDGLRRITGTAILLPMQKEEPGYALYSYALMSRHPQAGELPRVKACLTALLALPTAAAVEQNVPRGRINITYLPLEEPAPTWNILSTENKVNYVIDHYDYARGAAMVASLDQRTGQGPVIISLLKPLDLSGHPHPVLLQDLTSAEPSLMASYVTYFVNQTATDQFEKDETLSNFGLRLRNGLEVAAAGLGMSKDAVESWVKYFK